MAYMKCLLLAGILLVAAVGTLAEYRSLGERNFYVERELELNWHAAWNYCAAINMKLISIRTELEARQLKELLGEDYFFWTSGNALAQSKGNLTKNSFVWASTGQPLNYTNWLDGEPSNKSGTENCIHTVFPDFKWNDIDCETELQFICETAADICSSK